MGDIRLGMSLQQVRDFVRATEDWPGEEHLDCYTPSDTGVQVHALMGLYVSADVRCPRCATPLHGDQVLHSLSRVDNQTRICAPCGTAEALWDYKNPGAEMPPLDQKCR